MNKTLSFQQYADRLEGALADMKITTSSNDDQDLYLIACSVLDGVTMPMFDDVDAVILHTTARDDHVSAKMALEVGTALLLGLPLMVITTREAVIRGLPGNLSDLATVVVTLDSLDDPLAVSRAIDMTLDQMADRGLIAHRTEDQNDPPPGVSR